jgi:hypothetical protein
MGSAFTKHYRFTPALQGSALSLGTLGTAKGPSDWGRTFSDDGSRNYDKVFYAPYFYSNNYARDQYTYEVVDHLTSAGDLCNLKYDYTTSIPRYFKSHLDYGNVVTPVYSGPVVILRQIEGRYPQGNGWYTREDWYLARDIGIVQIEKEGLRDKCPGSNSVCDVNIPMTNPSMRLYLKNWYGGGPLTINITPTSVSRTGKYTLTARSTKGPYTGWLEAKVCISETSCTPDRQFKWSDWVQDGVANVDLSRLNLQPGTRNAVYRPWVERTPDDETGETRVTNTELPWSNLTRITLN